MIKWGVAIDSAHEAGTSGRTTPERNLRMLFKATLPPHFWARLRADPSGCWIWQGYIDRHGYGTFGKHGLVHRVVFKTLTQRAIPPELQLDHLCHGTSCAGGVTCLHRRCANPLHLEIVTGHVNWLRGRAPSVINASKTHCKHGHEFNDANTYRWKAFRFCRACNLRRVMTARKTRKE